MSLPLLYDGGEFMSPRLWAALFKSIVFDYQDFMAKNTKIALFFTHLNIPHIPIVFGAKGEMNSSVGNNPSSYKEELRYMDYVLGVLLGDIKKTSDYHKSLIIITADHSFREEEVPGLEIGNVAHVPFIIKAPMQKERQDIDAEFSALNLMEILKNYYSARMSGQYERLLHI
jgi:phosphoglycerol transferase MdoB-like AlkP superfamily enzyme